MLPALAAMAIPSLVSGLTSGGQQGGGNNNMLQNMMIGGALGGPAGMLLAPVLNNLFGGQQTQQPQQNQGISDQQFDHLMNRLDDLDRDIDRLDGGQVHEHHHYH